MPKLPTLTAEEIINLINKKGFMQDKSKGNHQRYINPTAGKRVVVPFRREIYQKERCWKFSGKLA